ncbi:hypothetical protein BpHYR1_019291 [Brachionus plicatilis]|uniref:Uncharacterized protein n=1 Tax=Brachionus plicatilis TaxID=10195 RepID=A0A3M7RHF2_BRAPC|nr:hypothetical protein BpHYR1_019291 [Brachionus plicatilis]
MILNYTSDYASLKFKFHNHYNFQKLRKSIYLPDCFSSFQTNNFTKFLGSIINNRQAVHPHSPLIIMPNSKGKKIPINLANVIHLRDKDSPIKAFFNEDIFKLSKNGYYSKTRKYPKYGIYEHSSQLVHVFRRHDVDENHGVG